MAWLIERLPLPESLFGLVSLHWVQAIQTKDFLKLFVAVPNLLQKEGLIRSFYNPFSLSSL